MNRNNPKVRQLVLEINSIHVKDPKHQPKTLILKIESQIERIKYQESIRKPYTPSKPTPEQLKNLKKIQPFYTAGKPYCLVTPDSNNQDEIDFYKALPPDQLKWYNFTSVVVAFYATVQMRSIRSGTIRYDGKRFMPNTYMTDTDMHLPEGILHIWVL